MEKVLKKMSVFATTNFVNFALIFALNLFVVFKVIPGRMHDGTLAISFYHAGMVLGTLIAIFLLKKIAVFVAYPHFMVRKKSSELPFFAALFLLEEVVLVIPFIGLLMAYFFTGGAGVEIPTIIWIAIEAVLWGAFQYFVWFPEK